MDVKKIVIIGPESTGKSMLCTQLAAHFRTNWCPEYAREYLLQYGTNYSYEDLLVIAHHQLRIEDEHAKSSNGLLFIDTNMYVMKVWCEYVFNKCHRFILDQVIERTYDLYLLCNTDLPWVKDELREYPDIQNRRSLFSIYKDILVNQRVPWAEISGGYDQRLPLAIEAVDELIAKNSF